VDVSPRDLVFTLPADEVASSSAAPRQLAATNLRYGGISWGDDDLALIYESWWKTRRSIVCTFAPARPDDGLKVGGAGVRAGSGLLSLCFCFHQAQQCFRLASVLCSAGTAKVRVVRMECVNRYLLALA